MKITTIEMSMIEAEYLASVNAAIAGKSLAMQRMLASQARAEVAVAALVAVCK
jgi:hypothetical protein